MTGRRGSRRCKERVAEDWRLANSVFRDFIDAGTADHMEEALMLWLSNVAVLCDIRGVILLGTEAHSRIAQQSGRVSIHPQPAHAHVGRLSRVSFWIGFSQEQDGGKIARHNGQGISLQGLAASRTDSETKLSQVPGTRPKDAPKRIHIVAAGKDAPGISSTRRHS